MHGLFNLPGKSFSFVIKECAIGCLGELVKSAQHTADGLIGGERSMISAHISLNPSWVNTHNNESLILKLSSENTCQHVNSSLGDAVLQWEKSGWALANPAAWHEIRVSLLTEGLKLSVEHSIEPMMEEMLIMRRVSRLRSNGTKAWMTMDVPTTLVLKSLV